MPRVPAEFQDGTTYMQELTRQLAEYIVDEVMSAEADEACTAALVGRMDELRRPCSISSTRLEAFG